MSNVTYKIDRLSNTKLSLGLKTGAYLQANPDYIFFNKPLTVDYNTAYADNDLGKLTTKKYVDATAVAAAASKVKTWLNGSEKITLSNSADGLSQTISLMTSRDAAFTYGSTTGGDTTVDSKKVIQSITVDKYGFVTGVTYKQMSSADLDNQGNVFDNYGGWQLGIGSSTDVATILSMKGADGLASTADVAAGKYALRLSGANGVNLALTAGAVSSTLAISLTLDPATLLADMNGLTLKSIMTAVDSNVYSFAVDKYGRITKAEELTTEKLAAKYKYFSGTDGVLIPANTTENQVSDAIPDSSNRYLNQNGKWATIPYTDVSVQSVSDSTEYSLVGTNSPSSGTVTQLFYPGGASTKITFNPNTGLLKATSFSGSGASLTSLNASTISSGTVALARLPTNIQNLNTLGSSITGYGTNSVLYVSASGTLSAVPEMTSANQANFVLTKKKSTSTASTAPEWIDITTIVSDQIGVALTSALIFKGFLGTSTSESTISDLPSTGKVGWMYKVSTAGTYGAGAFKCEINDSVYCVKDYDATTTITSENANDYWVVVQGNIDHAVTQSTDSYSTSTNYVLPVKVLGSDNTILYDSGMTYVNGILSATVTKANAITTPRSLWGNNFDGSADVKGNISNSGNITPETTITSTIGTTDLRYSAVWATTFNGDLSGTASVASKLANKLTISTARRTGSVVYDGSNPIFLTLDYANDKILTSTSATDFLTTTGTGNVIGSLSVAIDGTNGNTKLTATKLNAVTAISSSIFAIEATTATNPSIGWRSARPTSGTISFYTAGAGAVDSGDTSNTLYLNSKLYSATFYQLSSHAEAGMARVAEATSETLTMADGAPILTSFDLGSGYYEFVKSGFSIATNNGTISWDNDKYIPTALTVKNKIDSSLANKTKGQTKTMRLAFSAANDSSKTSSTTLAKDTLIKSVMVVCTAQITGDSPCVKVTDGISTDSDLVEMNDNDLSDAGVFEYSVGKKMSASGNPKIEFFASGTSAQIGSGNINSVEVYIDYVEPSFVE